jgi:hypothetical protein
MSDEQHVLEPMRWQPHGSKSVALLWLRSKNALLMQIAQQLKPEDINDEDAMNLFLDLTSLYSAMDCAIDMVEDVQNKVWAAEARNADLKLTIQRLSAKVAKYENQFDELDEYLR